METYEELKNTIVELGFNESEISCEKDIIKDLGLDSTERIALRAKLVKKYGVDIVIENNMTIGNLVDLIKFKTDIKKDNTSEVLRKLPIHSSSIDILTNKGGEIKVLISPKTVNSKQLILGTTILKPTEEIIEHIHDYGEEAMFIKSGTGAIFINGIEILLSPDSAVIIPQNAKHKLVNTGNVNLEIIFAAAPLAPNPKAGDRITN